MIEYYFHCKTNLQQSVKLQLRFNPKYIISVFFPSKIPIHKQPYTFTENWIFILPKAHVFHPPY